MSSSVLALVIVVAFVVLLVAGRGQIAKGANAQVANAQVANGAVLLTLAAIIGVLALGIVV